MGEDEGEGWGSTAAHPNPPPHAAEKAQLQEQLNTAMQQRKELGQNSSKAGAALGKARQEQERCQQELKATGVLCDTTKAQLEHLKGECDTLRSNVLYNLRTMSISNKNFGCSQVEEQLRLLMHRVEELFSRQQKHESDYVGKSICDLTLQQCHLNCSHEKLELGRRLQEVQQQLRGGQEEQRKLLAEKERLSKELGEKSKAAAQANYFSEQLKLCMSTKVGSSRARGAFKTWFSRGSLAHILLHGHSLARFLNPVSLEMRSCPQPSAQPHRALCHPRPRAPSVPTALSPHRRARGTSTDLHPSLLCRWAPITLPHRCQAVLWAVCGPSLSPAPTRMRCRIRVSPPPTGTAPTVRSPLEPHCCRPAR